MKDPVLAEIFHDADLMAEKDGCPESEGLDAIRRVQLSLLDDDALTRHTDALYAYLSRLVIYVAPKTESVLR